MWCVHTHTHTHTHTHREEYYSTRKKNEIDICSNMDGPRDCQTEWNKSDRERETSNNIAYKWNLKKNDTSELTKQKQTHKHIKQAYGYQRGKRGGRDKSGVGINKYTLLYIK